nr:hypothetical protein [Tanacetum cinerariifolium]
MDLYTFVHHVDPTKVQIGKRQIEKGQVPLLDSTVGRVIPLSGEDDQVGSVVRVSHGNQNDNIENVGHDDPNEESGDANQEDQSEGNDHVVQDETATILVDVEEDHGTSCDVSASTGRKYLAAIQGLFKRSILNVVVGVAAAATVPFITSSVTLRQNVMVVVILIPFMGLICVLNIHLSFVLPPPVMTAAVTTTNVASASSALVLGAMAEPVSQVHPKLSADNFYVSQEMDFETLRQIYVPKWNVVN